MSSEGYLARQPIIDTQHQVVAYELLFRAAPESNSALIDNALQAGVELINNTLCIGTDWLLNGKLAFINVDEATLMSDFITLLPAQSVVFEVLETVRSSPAILGRMHELKQRGYQIALDDFVPQPEYQSLVSLADYIKLDVLEQPQAKIQGNIRELRRLFGGKLVAEKVESWQMYDVCRSGGMDYFQGYYFARPENITAKKIEHAQVAILDLLNKVRIGDNIRSIDEAIRRDAALTYKLLRYVNSAAFGLSRQVYSVQQAVTILGFQALYRWLSLLLVTASDHQAAQAMAGAAAVRGRMCELLGQGRMGRHEQEELFLVGLFSMLDTLFNVPLEKILERLMLPDRIVRGLLHREGLYGPYLNLVEACESRDFARIEADSCALGLNPVDVNTSQLQAVAWVEGLSLS